METDPDGVSATFLAQILGSLADEEEIPACLLHRIRRSQFSLVRYALASLNSVRLWSYENSQYPRLSSVARSLSLYKKFLI